MSKLTPEAIEFLNQIAQASRGAQPGGFAGQAANTSIDPYNVRAPQMHSQTRSPDSFFGPIGTVAAGFMGLTSRDAYGQDSPIFKTNLTFAHDNTRSSFSTAMLDHNTNIYNQTATRSTSAQGAAWADMFGDGGAGHRMIDSKNAEGNYILSNGTRNAMHAVGSILARPELANIAMPEISRALGYDRGASASLFLDRSGQMMAGMRARMPGGGGVYGTMGADGVVKQDGSFHMANPFSQSYQDMRAAVSATGEDAVQKMMYDGMLKKDSMHGASEILVGNILADAISSGSLDESALGGESFDKLMKDRLDLTSQQGDLAEQIRQKKADRENAVEGSDTADRLDSEIEQLEQEFTQVQGQIDGITQKVVDAASPLVEAVTGAVDAMKDFYGSEIEAARMLNTLTGGQGTKDKAVAQRTMQRMDELNVMSNLAGMDPSLVGKHLQRQQGLWGFSGTGLSEGNALSGNMAMMSEARMMRAMVGLAGNGRAQAQLMDAAEGRTKAGADSRGYKVLTALVASKEAGRFKGNEDEYNEIMQDLQSSDPKRRKAAEKRAAVRIAGSQKGFDRMIHDPQTMAMLAESISPEGREAVSAAWDAASVNETDAMMERAGETTKERSLREALSESGFRTDFLNRQLDSAEFNSLNSQLEKLSENGDSGATHAKRAFNSMYEAALKKTGGDKEKAMRLAVQQFKSSGASNMITDEENRASLDTAMHEGRMETLKNLSSFGENQRSFFTFEGQNSELGKYIGQNDNGSVSRVGLMTAGTTIFDALRQNKEWITKDNGEAYTNDEIKELQEKFKTAVEEGNGHDAGTQLVDLLAGMSGTGKEFLMAQLNQQGYLKDEDIEKMTEGEDLLTKVSRNAEARKSMAGMTDDEAMVWATNWDKLRSNDISDEEREKLTKENEEIKKAAAERAKSDGEKIVQGIQNGDLTKVLEAFVANGHSVDEATDKLKKFAEMLGVIVDGPEGKSLSNLSMATEDDFLRTNWLGNNTMTMGARAEMSSEDAADYMAILSGKDVDKKTLEEYEKNAKVVNDKNASDKSRKKSYVNMLDSELDALSTSEKDLKKKIKDSTGDEKAALESQLEGVTRQQKALKKQRDDVSSMSPEKFVETLGSAVEKVESEKTGDNGKGSNGEGKGDSNLVTKIDTLVGKVDELCDNLDRNLIHNGG